MSNYWKHVSVVFSGAVVAQLIPIIGTLFIARIYTPADYGAYSFWLAVVLILTVALTLRYEAAIALENDGDERSIAVLAILLTIVFIAGIVAVGLLIVCILFPELVERFSEQAVISLVPASVLLSGNMVLQSWAAADGRYHQLNLLRLVFAGLVTTLQILGGLVCASELTLLLMHTLGLLFSFCFAFWLKPVRVGSSVSTRFAVTAFIRRRKRFAIYSLPADLISSATGQLPLMIVTSRFGSEAGGVLALTTRILGAPLGLLGKAVLDVFKRYAVIEIKETGSCSEIYIKTFRVLLFGSVLLTVGVVSFAQSFFNLAFGASWGDAGLYAIWLLPLFAMKFMASPLSYTIYIVEKQNLDFLWQIGLLVISLIGLLASDSLNSTVLLYSSLGALMYIVYLILSFKLSR
ncbi:lipopolysaccharide biosynthesis protein [Thalassolituus oleivorans]|uniref:lipopolysaccharide biosynthesis protein n=1 Tax=Thalassolituus oleivorans TaxID=187493 RepID=UPI0023EF6363|nr:oligosaccharide flippase family protein [Thalassolituus oleivorans]